MNKKIIKPAFAVIVPLLSGLALTGCTSKDNQNAATPLNTTASQGNDASIESGTNTTTNTDQGVLTNDSTAVETQLTVSSGCRGCGKCVRTDPEHFTFSQATHKATVISQENLNSTELNQAIQNCPEQAIFKV